MKWSRTLGVASVAAVAALAASAVLHAQNAAQMTYFVTSVGAGSKSADLGGLAGADAHCAALAKAAGAGNHTWRAYLSTQAKDGQAAVDARSRIGKGPWTNAKGIVVAKSVDDLHSDSNQLTKENNLTETGALVPGRGDGVNEHDALTGSTADGRAFPPEKDMTCGNWTKSGEGTAMLGHIDRKGLSEEPPQKSWNSSHPSRGCSPDLLKASGGAGRFYCFAAD